MRKGKMWTLTNRLGYYLMLLRQWKAFPTRMRTTLLGAIRAEIVKKSQKAGVKVRWVQDTACDVNEEELRVHAQQLREDLEKAATEDLLLDYPASPTEKDWSKDDGQLTRINAGGEISADSENEEEGAGEVDCSNNQRTGNGGEGNRGQAEEQKEDDKEEEDDEDEESKRERENNEEDEDGTE